MYSACINFAELNHYTLKWNYWSGICHVNTFQMPLYDHLIWLIITEYNNTHALTCTMFKIRVKIFIGTLSRRESIVGRPILLGWCWTSKRNYCSLSTLSVLIHVYMYLYSCNIILPYRPNVCVCAVLHRKDMPTCINNCFHDTYALDFDLEYLLS